MSSQDLSMREASRVLGVSQLRVRELLRKGTLQGQKIVDGAGERWTILNSSVQDYLERRVPKASDNGHQPAAGAERSFGELIRGLELQLGRIRTLVEELAKGQAFLDGLRSAQRVLEAELAAARRAASEIRAAEVESEDPAELARKAVEAAKRAVEAAKLAEQPRKDVEKAPDPAAAKPDPAAAKPDPAVATRPERAPAKATKPKPAKKAPEAIKPQVKAVKKQPAPAPKTKTALGAALHRAGVAAKPARKSPGKKK